MCKGKRFSGVVLLMTFTMGIGACAESNDSFEAIAKHRGKEYREAVARLLQDPATLRKRLDQPSSRPAWLVSALRYYLDQRKKAWSCC